jgi:hypothetical protein
MEFLGLFLGIFSSFHKFLGISETITEFRISKKYILGI